VTLDAAFVKALVEDYENAPLSEADRAMLDYATQLTEDATRIQKKDHERLRAVGFDDRGILQITLIASWFNYINRVADALGVGREGRAVGKEQGYTKSAAARAALRRVRGVSGGAANTHLTMCECPP
jgi:hypothetical protein